MISLYHLNMITTKTRGIQKNNTPDDILKVKQCIIIEIIFDLRAIINCLKTKKTFPCEWTFKVKQTLVNQKLFFFLLHKKRLAQKKMLFFLVFVIALSKVMKVTQNQNRYFKENLCMEEVLCEWVRKLLVFLLFFWKCKFFLRMCFIGTKKYARLYL